MTKQDYDGSEKYDVDQMQDVPTPHLAAEQEGLKRDLRLRHMIMIAVSGTIGTGLFLTSGSTIATAGPGGACKFPCRLVAYSEL
jgi:lysine-specific permease